MKLKTTPPMMLSALLLLSACDAPAPPQTHITITDRPVATVYKVKSTGAAAVSCYRIQHTTMIKITTLKSEQLVDIVAVEEGLIEFDDKLWLQVYPRLTHRPSCYVNVDNLIPYG